MVNFSGALRQAFSLFNALMSRCCGRYDTKTHNLHALLSIAVSKQAILAIEMQKKLYYMCVSELAFCNWVGSRPVHIHTLNGPYQS